MGDVAGPDLGVVKWELLRILGADGAGLFGSCRPHREYFPIFSAERIFPEKILKKFSGFFSTRKKIFKKKF
jgi:hypothetical protein